MKPTEDQPKRPTCIWTGRLPSTQELEQTDRAERNRAIAKVLRHDAMRIPPSTIEAVRESALERARRLEAEAADHEAEAKRLRGY